MEWKTANVVLIPKPGREDMSQPSSYRLICLISTVVKLFNYMVQGRLMEELRVKGGLSKWQFRFVERKSTVHAVIWLLDVIKEYRN